MKRMYILVLDDLEIGTAINTACHAAVATELNLNNRETAITFKPRDEYHKMFKFLKLYRWIMNTQNIYTIPKKFDK